MFRIKDVLQTFRSCVIALWVLVLSGTALPTQARNAEIFRYDLADTVETLVEELASGSKQGRQVLEALDPGAREAITKISSGRDYKHTTFSARTQVQALYNMAEAHSAGEGERFIAKLHRQLAPVSAQVKLDPGLQAISRNFSQADLDRPLNFASPETMVRNDLLRPLPQNVEAAVDLLSRTMAPNDLGTVVTKMTRHLRLARSGEPPRRVIDKAIATSPNRKAVLHQIINAHAPPPRVQDAVRSLMMDVVANHAALGSDRAVMKVLEGLAEEAPPSELRKIQELGTELPSRKAQKSAAAFGTTVSQSPDVLTAERKIAEILAQGGVEALGNAGPGPSPNSGPSYRANRKAHAIYKKNIPVRKYSRAIRSSRAARGVAVGGKITPPAGHPTGAFWIPSRDDDSFGRIVVSVQGEERLAVSRFLFADSFEAAVSTLWDDHGDEAAFRDDEITIVMSMDPDSEVGAERREEILTTAEAKLEDLRKKALLASEEDRLALVLQAFRIRNTIEEQMQELPRGIVVHPALHGRELAWAAARVDFWFNDLARLSDEAVKLGNTSLKSSLATGFPKSARTWQFYERDSKLTIEASRGPADKLRVLSPDDAHFSVSLFSFADSQPSPNALQDEDGVWRLVSEEKAIQPLLAWALRSHPDFIRLNDYSEALSILRWIGHADAKLVIFDADGQPGRIATPDRVLVGEVGPRAGE